LTVNVPYRCTTSFTPFKTPLFSFLSLPSFPPLLPAYCRMGKFSFESERDTVIHSPSISNKRKGKQSRHVRAELHDLWIIVRYAADRGLLSNCRPDVRAPPPSTRRRSLIRDASPLADVRHPKTGSTLAPTCTGSDSRSGAEQKSAR